MASPRMSMCGITSLRGSTCLRRGACGPRMARPLDPDLAALPRVKRWDRRRGCEPYCRAPGSKAGHARSQQSAQRSCELTTSWRSVGVSPSRPRLPGGRGPSCWHSDRQGLHAPCSLGYGRSSALLSSSCCQPAWWCFGAGSSASVRRVGRLARGGHARSWAWPSPLCSPRSALAAGHRGDAGGARRARDLLVCVSILRQRIQWHARDVGRGLDHARIALPGGAGAARCRVADPASPRSAASSRIRRRCCGSPRRSSSSSRRVASTRTTRLLSPFRWVCLPALVSQRSRRLASTFAPADLEDSWSSFRCWSTVLVSVCAGVVSAALAGRAGRRRSARIRRRSGTAARPSFRVGLLVWGNEPRSTPWRIAPLRPGTLPLSPHDSRLQHRGPRSSRLRSARGSTRPRSWSTSDRRRPASRASCRSSSIGRSPDRGTRPRPARSAARVRRCALSAGRGRLRLADLRASAGPAMTACPSRQRVGPASALA